MTAEETEAQWDAWRAGIMGLGERVRPAELWLLLDKGRCVALFGEGFYRLPASERVALVRSHLTVGEA